MMCILLGKCGAELSYLCHRRAYRIASGWLIRLFTGCVMDLVAGMLLSQKPFLLHFLQLLPI